MQTDPQRPTQRTGTSSLAGALIALVALPGTVAFVVPLVLAWPRGWESLPHPAGLVLVAIGTALLLWCVREFYVSGRGTLAPWAPPRTLVVTGPYRMSRNPMYVAVLVMLSGWAVGLDRAVLWGYLAGVAVAFHARRLARRAAPVAPVAGRVVCLPRADTTMVLTACSQPLI